MGDPTHSGGPVHADLPRLRRLLGAPELGRLVQRLRSRLELGRPLVGSVALADATEAERAAVEGLLGRGPRPGRSLSVPLDAVDRVLRESGACPDGLAAAVVALTGPVASRADAAERLDRAWEAACVPMAELVERSPRLSGWWTGVLASGLVRRLLSTPGEAAEVLHDLARVLDGLPRPTPQSLPAYAATTTGNSHALDQGPLATLALGAAAALVGAVPGAGAERRREIWAEAGLLQDPLSSQVLALNLPGDVGTATGRALAALAEAGEPTVLTLRQLAGDRVVMSGSGRVYVCENPAVVVAAADRLGADSPPLVCLQGQPSIAALRLLRQLTESGWSLRYHGDFDWGGLRIASRLRDHVPWTPWRYTTADLRAALAAHSGTAPLVGALASAPWDPDLAATLGEAGRRIEEELLLDLLIDDLASTYESVDDSSGRLGSVVEELGEVHLDACLAAQAAPEETAEWLFAHLTGPGGDLLDIDVTDYFGVLGAAGKARLDALVTEAWHRHPSNWTLKYLKQQLARLEDDVDAIVAVYAADLAPTGATHLQVARELDAVGRSREALEWAARGLQAASSAAPAGRVDSGLVDYLCDRYQAAGRAELAVEIRRDRLCVELSLAAYQRLRRAAQADGCWPAERGPALEVLRAEALKQAERPWRSPAAWIDALVDDGDLEEAWAAATGVATDQQWLCLADRVSAQRPGDALKVYLRAVEPLTAVTGDAAYQQILRLLVSARACHEALGTMGEFDVYVAALRAGQKRKRNLLRLLDQHGM